MAWVEAGSTDCSNKSWNGTLLSVSSRLCHKMKSPCAAVVLFTRTDLHLIIACFMFSNISQGKRVLEMHDLLVFLSTLH